MGHDEEVYRKDDGSIVIDTNPNDNWSGKEAADGDQTNGYGSDNNSQTSNTDSAADKEEQKTTTDQLNPKVIASEPSGSSQEELTESDTTKTSSGNIIDEDQVIKENEVNTGEQESFKQIENQLQKTARQNKGKTGRQAEEALQTLEKAQKQGQAKVIQTQDQLKILGRRKTRDQPKTVGERLKSTEKKSNRPFAEYTDIGTLLDPTEGNPNATIAEEFTTAGVDLINKGQKFGKNTAAKIPDSAFRQASKTTASQKLLGIPNPATKTAQASTVIEALVDASQNKKIKDEAKEFLEISKPGSSQEEKESIENIAKGIYTGGSAVTGLGISSLGAIPRASATTTQKILDVKQENRKIAQSSDTGLVEGAATGITLTGKQIAKNPDKFVGQEVGEEIGEAAVFGTLTGGAGVAISAVPTPDFEVEPDVRGKAASAKNTVQQMRNADSTTSQAGGRLVLNQVNNDVLAATTQQPDTDVGPGRTPGPRSQTNPETDTDTLAGIQTDQEILTGGSETDTNLENAFLDNTRTGTPSLEDNLSQPGSNTQPQSDVLSRPESDIIGEVETKTETKSEPQTEPTVFGDVQAETQTEPETQPEIKSELIPELNTRPGGEFGGQQEEENNGVLAGLVSDQKGFKRTTSVGAELLGLKDKDGKTKLSAGNPLNLRPELK